MSVGVMKDEKVKVRDLHTSSTLGCPESTRLVYTVLLGELDHLKIKTRLIDEMFPSVMGEHVFLK
jgi:hypothetical protein